MNRLKRIYKGIGANTFGQAVTILIQLSSVPILVSAWGLDKYGEWLLITAIPVYLAFSDFGLAATSANKITILFEKNRIKLANRIHQATFSITLILSILILFIAFSLQIAIDFDSALQLTHFQNTGLLVTALIAHTLMSLQSNVFLTSFRAIKKLPTGIVINNFIRAIEWGIALAAVLYTNSEIYLIASLLIIRGVGMIALFTTGRHVNSKLVLNKFSLDKRSYKILLKPSLATMSFPIGLALMIQGFTILITTTLGGAAAAVFNIYRTLARLLIQAVAILNQALWPEITYAFANNDINSIKIIIKKSGMISICASLVTIPIIFIFHEEIIYIWLNSNLPNNTALLSIVLISTIIHILWQRYWVFLMATNTHNKFSIAFLGASIFSLTIAYLLIKTTSLEMACLSLIAFEVICLYFSHRFFHGIIKNATN